MKSVKDELEYIQKKNKGLLNPRNVVEFAKNPETCLHSKFTWDDSKAAHEYRLLQARHIIRLELKIIHRGNNTIETNEYVSLTIDRKPDGGYRPIVVVMEDEYLRQQMLKDALNELIRIKSKYKQLEELSSIFGEIDKLELEFKTAEVE